MSTQTILRPRSIHTAGGLQISAMGIAVIAVAASAFVRDYLPSRFLLDSNHIQDTIHSAFAASETQSYRNVAAMYQAIGLGDAPRLATVVTMVLFSIAVFAAARWDDLARFGIVAATVFIVAFAYGLIYLAQYSKETLSLMVVLLLLITPKWRAAEVFFLAACVTYAVFVRPYWGIVAILYLFWRFVLPRIRNPFMILGLIVAIYAAIEFVFVIYVGESLSSERQSVNVFRSSQDVGTLIVPPIPISGILAGPAAVVMFACLVFPVQLVLDGGISHQISAAIIVSLWTVAAWGAIRLFAAGESSGRQQAGADASRNLRARRAVALLLAFVMVQALFEPDYGSYIKHLTPLLPLFLTLVPLRRTEVMT